MITDKIKEITDKIPEQPAVPNIKDAEESPKVVANPHIINMFKSLLDMAEKGQIESFVGAGILSDGQTFNSFTPISRDFHRMYGALSMLPTLYLEKQKAASIGL